MASGSSSITSSDFDIGTSWVAVPATSTKAVHKSGTISEGLVYTGYKVHISSTQEADTYTGKVRYTVAPGV